MKFVKVLREDGRQEDYHSPIGKVVCVGRNYAAHARELDNPIPEQPLLFLKPATSVVPFEQDIPALRHDEKVHYEAELAVLVGDTLAGEVSVDKARGAIAALGIGLDLTLRELQGRLKENGHPWETAKAFDGACPLTGFVACPVDLDLTTLHYQLYIDGALRQEADTGQMLVTVCDLLRYAARHFTLEPGDLVLTGTPAGVGSLAAGQSLRVTSSFGVESVSHCTG